MRRVIFFALVLLGYTSLTHKELNASNGPKNRTAKIGVKDRFPFALLTDDFGILNVNDMAMNACDADPVAFSWVPGSYPYWQCFPINQISFRCDPAGPSGKAKEETALLLIDIVGQQRHQQYVPRRAMEMSNCRWFQQNWKTAIRKQQFACLSGSFSGFEGAGDRGVAIWVFDKFKTKRRCQSYFHGGCSASYARRQGCEI